MTYPVLRPSAGVPDHHRPDAPAPLVDAAREFVGGCRWTWAVTFANNAPHWYTLRRDAEATRTTEGYDALRALVLDHHYLRSWRGRSFRAVSVGGVLIWAMQTGGILLNGLPASPDDFDQEPSLFEFI